jgi:hypothetical protein
MYYDDILWRSFYIFRDLLPHIHLDGGWLVGYWESAILIFCVCLALMAIDLKMSDLEIEISGCASGCSKTKYP